MNNKMTKFIEWAIAIDNSLSRVTKTDTMLTEEECSDLKDIVARYERAQNAPIVTRAEFIHYMLDNPVFKFTPSGGNDSRIYQYSSQSRKYADNFEDLVVYQGFNGEYYHWISKAALDADIAKKRKRERKS
jgi:hypothetical protein